jgi:hypothetical protein
MDSCEPLESLAQNDAFEIVCSTENEAEWLAKREELVQAGYVNGSSIGKVMGLHKKAGPYTVWAQATGLITPNQPHSDDLDRGRFLEDGVARWFFKAFREETGRDVCGEPLPFMVKSTRYPLCATLDWGWSEDGDPLNPLEVKTTREDWAKFGVPPHIIAQAMTQAVILGTDAPMLAVSRFYQKPNWATLVLDDVAPEDGLVSGVTWEAAIIHSAQAHHRAVAANTAPEATVADLETVAIQPTKNSTRTVIGDEAETLRLMAERHLEGSLLVTAGKALKDAATVRTLQILGGAMNANSNTVTVTRGTRKGKPTKELTFNIAQ